MVNQLIYHSGYGNANANEDENEEVFRGHYFYCKIPARVKENTSI